MKIIKQTILTLFLLTFLSINIFAEVNIDNSNDELTNNNISSYDLGIIIKLIQDKSRKSNDDKQIIKIENEIEKIIKNINTGIYYSFDNDVYEKDLRYLSSKIDINSKHENGMAVARDMMKISILNTEKIFADTINSIISGKSSYKNKKFFFDLLDKKIEETKSIKINDYKKTYNLVLQNEDSLSKEYKDTYNQLDGQIKANLLIFNYLKTNINEYRKQNFILDELSLNYIIEKIDNYSYIKNFSNILHYHFNISIGKIIILTLILVIFIILKKAVFPFFIKLFKKYIYKKLNIKLIEILPKSFNLIISIIFYSFALELAIFLMIEDSKKIFVITPWFNTLYLSLISLLAYNIVTNYINLSSEELFKNYPNMRKEMVDFILRITKVLIVIFLALFLLVQLGFDIKAILASLGIGGIAVALAAKDTLSNFFGSLNIITDNSFSQGDWIVAGNIEGTVVDIRMRTTRIRTFDNGMITVPNAQLANMSILNWSKRIIGRRIKMSIGVTYASKMSDIENLANDIKEMLQNHPKIATNKLSIDKKPYLLKKEDLLGIKNNLLVYIDEYANSSINILVYCFSRSADWEDWLETKQDVIIKISELVEKNHCEFAFPTQTIYLEKEDKA